MLGTARRRSRRHGTSLVASRGSFVVEARPGSPVRQLTTFAGADNDPDWQSAPAWSPDGRYIAYLQGKDPKVIYYGVHQLAIVPEAAVPRRS